MNFLGETKAIRESYREWFRNWRSPALVDYDWTQRVDFDWTPRFVTKEQADANIARMLQDAKPIVLEFTKKGA